MATIEQVLADLGIVDDTVSINTQEDMLSGKARMPVAIPTDVSRESEGGDSEQEWNEFCQDGDRYDPQDYPLNPEDVTNAEYTGFHDALEAAMRADLQARGLTDEEIDIAMAGNYEGDDENVILLLGDSSVTLAETQANNEVARLERVARDPVQFMEWCRDRQSTSSDALMVMMQEGHEIRWIPYGNPELNEYCVVSATALEEARHCNPDVDDIHILGNRAYEWHQLIHGFMGETPENLEISLEILDIEYELYHEDDQCMYLLKGTKYTWCLYLDAYQSPHMLYTMTQSLLF